MMHRLIDRIDTFCYDHIWVPVWVRVWVGRLWQRTMRHDKQESGPSESKSLRPSRIRSAKKLGLTGDGE